MFYFAAMKNFCLLTLIVLCISACQKEISTELNDNDPPSDSTATGVDAFYMKIEDANNIWMDDSIVIRYGVNKIEEVLFNEWVDSSTKTYLYDASGKLIGINCPE